MDHEKTHSDLQIARTIAQAIHADQPEISTRVRIHVDRGLVTLTGNVDWQHQRNRAEGTARLVRGVVNVKNDIVAVPCVEPAEIKRRIALAFARSAAFDVERINVRVDRGTVVLTGRVSTWTEWTDAQTAAQSAPGVTQVQNEITVGT
jgi:osmotically-inducible protein OsmY